MIKVAIFASDNSDVAENFYTCFRKHPQIKVQLFVCNRNNSEVVSKAHELKQQLVLVTQRSFFYADLLIGALLSEGIDYIVLSDFTWKLPHSIVSKYKGRILNLQPALLPKYAGKGMYGDKLQKLILQNQDSDTGFTIHLVDEFYNTGTIIEQKMIPIPTDVSSVELRSLVRNSELEVYTQVFENYVKEKSLAI